MKHGPRSSRWLLGLGLLTATACGGATGAPNRSAAAATSGNEANARDYAIRLERPWRVGARGRWRIDAEKRMNLTRRIGDQAPEQRDNAVTAHLDATFEVRGVDAQGHSTRELYTIEDFTVSQGDQTVHPLQAGQRVEIALADQSEDSVITVDGQPAAGTVREALALVTSLEASHDNGDELAGTSQRQPIGGTWEIHREAMQRSLHRAADVEIALENLSGEVRLAGLETEGGVPCLDVRTNVHIDGFQPPGLPAGFSVERSTMSVQSRDLYPLDQRAQERRSSYEIAMEFALQARTPRGDEVRADTHMSERRVTTFTPLN
jgi:hypothetical protein